MGATVARAQTVRPLWVGVRWGMIGAGVFFAVILGGIIGYSAFIYRADGGEITTSDLLPGIFLYFLPASLFGLLFGAIGGALTMPVVYWLLARMPSVRRGWSWLIALGVCLLFLVVVAAPVLVVLARDGNFGRGLEEMLIFGIPFYLVPGTFYVVAMIMATRRYVKYWFPQSGQPS